MTDLNKAIKQTADYIGILYQQQELPMQAFAKKRQRYWKDGCRKLGGLKKQFEAGKLNEVFTDGFASIKQ